MFYKFHSDNRKPIMSDIYDILIAMNAPYVDAFVTEGQVVDCIKKIKKFDSFINHLEVLSVKEI